MAIYNDLLAWDGKNWSKLTPKAAPPLMSRAGFVSIKKSEEISMYGGTTTTSTTVPASDMWRWDGSTWTQVTQKGGHNVSPKAGTYEYDGTSWSKRTVTSPGSRSGPAMGYIAVQKKTIAFGGYTGKLPMMDDTFEYQTD